MSRTVLLTLGRLPKGLDLARCLHAAGCTVYVADPFGTHLCKPSNAIRKSIKVAAPNTDKAQYLNDILALADTYKIDLIIPVSEEVLHVAALESRLPKGVVLLCPPLTQLAVLHEKFSFIAAARAAGLCVPVTLRGDDPDAPALAASRDYVVKPALGCSGTGLRLARAGEPLAPEEQRGEMIVQERLAGQEVSTLSFVHDGEVLASVSYRGLIFAGTVATCFERMAASASIDDWIAQFVKAQRYTGFIAFDFILDAQGTARPIECNPRLTSGLHFFKPSDLAAAVLDRKSASPEPYRPEKRLQEGHTSLTKAYSALPDIREVLRRIKLVLTTRDVLWQAGDPLPFILMTPMSWPILSKALFGGASFGEAAIADIEWLVDDVRLTRPYEHAA